MYTCITRCWRFDEVRKIEVCFESEEEEQRRGSSKMEK
jgi:hypothetical protein